MHDGMPYGRIQGSRNVAFALYSLTLHRLRLQTDKAAGDDNMSPRLLKSISSEIALPVAIIFRKSLDTGCVPRDWRTANITPLFKQEAQLMLTTGSTRLAVNQGQQT